jgi:hypothetical protein
MTDITITALPAASVAQATDVFPADQLPGPVTRKITLEQVLSLFQGSSVISLQGTANEVLVNGTSGSPVTGTAITLTTPQGIATTSTPIFAGFNDTNNNAMVGFTTSVDAVNYLNIQNGSTAGGPLISAQGADESIDITVQSKNSGTINLIANVPGANPSIVITSGTDGQHNTSMQFPDTAEGRSIVWPDATGTVALTSDGTIAAGLLGQVGYYAEDGVVLSGLSTTGTGYVVRETSPILSRPQVDNIYDTNGNIIIGLNPVASATNYIQITNSPDTVVSMSVDGTSEDIGLALESQGQQPIYLISHVEGSSSSCVLQTGTGASHVTNLVFPDTINTRTVTYPDASGTMTLLGNSSTGTGDVVLQNSPSLITPNIGAATGSSIQLSSSGGIVGVTDGSYAATGYVGEPTLTGLENVTYSASGVLQNIVGLPLTPGNWLVNAYVVVQPTIDTTSAFGGLSITSLDPSITGFGLGQFIMTNSLASTDYRSQSLGLFISVGSSVTVYLETSATFTTAPSIQVQLGAVRIR